MILAPDANAGSYFTVQDRRSRRVEWMTTYAFAPFGGGAHKCIGMVFGQLEIKTVMHRVLRRYRLELSRPGYRPRYDYGGMPVPIDGMPLVLRPRR